VKHSLPQPIRAIARTYQLKVTLRAVAPPIWRRFQVRGDVRLSELHRVLQAVMGWTESHRYKFEIAGVDYGPPDAEATWGNRNDRKARLDKVANSAGAAITYHYDFANGWEHAIVVEAIRPAEPGVDCPICMIGEYACPPEDCGGRPGYGRLLSAFREPDRPQHYAILKRFSGTFDPDAFDLAAINRRLVQLPSPT
jgi:pRiA4b ORF-3-like protein